MRIHHLLAITLLLSPCHGQAVPQDPNQQMREEVARWMETMSRIQREESDWARDREVLANYKEGLVNEIATLKQSIAEAETRKAGADKASLDLSAERDRYAAAKSALAKRLRGLEQQLMPRLGLFPKPLTEDPKVSQAIADLKIAINLPDDKIEENVSKRLLNVITLLGEAEKFQQTVHVRPELHRDKAGREFNMRVIYFGLAMAYAVNDDGTLALTGRPSGEGWVFEETPALSAEIQNLLAATTGDAEAAFISLPYKKP
jgi:hypothetical protein